MTDLDLDAIEARAAYVGDDPVSRIPGARTVCLTDVPALVAEVRRLREAAPTPERAIVQAIVANTVAPRGDGLTAVERLRRLEELICERGADPLEDDPIWPFEVGPLLDGLRAEVERLQAVIDTILDDLPTYCFGDMIWAYIRRDDILGVVRGDD